MKKRTAANSYDPRDYSEILESLERKRKSYLEHREARLEARSRAASARASYFRARLRALLVEYEDAR